MGHIIDLVIRLRPKQILLWVRRHKLRTTLLIAVVCLLALSLTPIIILVRTYGIVHPDLRPNAKPTPFVLETQTEPDTCGLHALSTIYRAYGLDAEDERLRWRLGIDTKAVFWIESSTGALHPDIWMVLDQDGFAVDPIDTTASDAWDHLQDHTQGGHAALLLTVRPQTGGMHWVVAVHNSDDGVSILDPLQSEPLPVESDYLAQHAITAWRIQPRDDDSDKIGSMTAHKRGSVEAAAAVKHKNG